MNKSTFWSRLKDTKSLKLCAAGICTAVGTYLADQIDLTTLIFAIFNGFAYLFLRDGEAKNAPKGV